MNTSSHATTKHLLNNTQWGGPTDGRDNQKAKIQKFNVPTGLALVHPAAPTLQEYATYGCPAKMGKP